MATETAYLFLSLVPDTSGIKPVDGLLKEKLKRKKQFYHCHLAFDDGTVLDCNYQGIFAGKIMKQNQRISPYVLPIIERRDDLIYRCKPIANIDRVAITQKASRLIATGITGMHIADAINILNDIEVEDIKNLKRMTDASFVAYLLGYDFYYKFDTDDVSNRVGTDFIDFPWSVEYDD